MARIDFLQKKIAGYLRKEQLLKKDDYVSYSRKVYIVTNITYGNESRMA